MTPRLNSFPRSHRLSTPSRFAAVYDARVRESRGPLAFYAIPNDLGHMRMGLSVSRKVGSSPRRHRIKRLLREAYRNTRHELPGNYDLVVVVRPHEPLTLAVYQSMLIGAIEKLHDLWQRKNGSGGTARVGIP